MADTKISALTDGVAVAATDRIPVARTPFASGDNRYVTGTELADFVLGIGDFREALTADRNYYIRTDGSDSHTGLANTAGGAWLTLQHAFDVIATEIDLGIYAVTITMGAGEFDGATLGNVCPGGVGILLEADQRPNIRIIGNGSGGGGSSTIIDSGGNPDGTDVGINIGCPAGVELSELHFKSSFGVGSYWGYMEAYAGGNIYIRETSTISWTGDTGKTDGPFFVGNGGYIRAENCNISALGGGLYLAGATNLGLISFRASTITMTGTPDWGNTMLATLGGAIDLSGAAFSGAATGGRFTLRTGGQIWTNDTNPNTFIPGNVNGFISSGFYDTYQFIPCAVADLPDVADVAVGYRAVVTNSNTTTFAATVAGGGANIIPVWNNGTNWKVG